MTSTWPFSNFRPAEVYFDGVLYRTVEHAYQAAKTLDPTGRHQIRIARSPAQAKRLGQQVVMRPGWDQIKTSVMALLLWQKFSSDPWRTMLVNTGDDPIIEWTTWHDTYWGKCTCATHKGEGQNMLGQTLMQIRAQLRDRKEVHV